MKDRCSAGPRARISDMSTLGTSRITTLHRFAMSCMPRLFHRSWTMNTAVKTASLYSDFHTSRLLSEGQEAKLGWTRAAEVNHIVGGN